MGGSVVRWIEPHASAGTVAPFDAAHYLRALRELDALLGCEV